MTFTLRDYQDTAIDDCRRSFARGNRRILLQAPTGSGKTVIAAQVVEGAANKGRHILFLAHRRELVEQCGDKLVKFGVDHGVIMAGEYPELYFEVQVASIDTLRARCLKSNKLPLPKADVIIIDEAHRSLAPTYLKIMEAYPEAAILGLTATPIRGDGKGLGHIYEDIVHCPSVQELTDLGYLVPARYFAPTIPDLTGVKITAGDYDKAELEGAMNRRSLVGDILTQWMRIGRDRPTIIFATGVKHSIHIRDEFVKAGIRAEHIDGDTATAKRAEIIRGVHSGAVQVVTNCMVLTEGFDEPMLSCCVLARPTKNIGLYLQMAGRVIRPSKGKDDTLIIDHSGNVYEHGFVADPHRWSLDTRGALTSERDERQQEFDEKNPITCVKCCTVYTGQIVCPTCGHVPVKRGRRVETRHGELMELRASKRRTAKKKTYSLSDKQKWFSMFLYYAQEKNKSSGWVAHSYRSKFKVWPRKMIEHPMPPDGECLAYIRHRNIAYAKSMEKRNKVA